MELFIRRSGWVLMSLLCVALAVTTLRYFGSDTSEFFQPDIYSDQILVLRLHIAAGIAAVLVGPLQFSSFVRNRFRSLHRAFGAVYILAVLIGAVIAAVLAATALGGIVSQAGFSMMAVFWAGTTIVAYWQIRNRDINAHKRWMTRSFAVTFGFVMLRIIFGTLEYGVGLAEVTAFQIAAWACWIPNLIIVEYALRNSTPFRGPRT